MRATVSMRATKWRPVVLGAPKASLAPQDRRADFALGEVVRRGAGLAFEGPRGNEVVRRLRPVADTLRSDHGRLPLRSMAANVAAFSGSDKRLQPRTGEVGSVLGHMTAVPQYHMQALPAAELAQLDRAHAGADAGHRPNVPEVVNPQGPGLIMREPWRSGPCRRPHRGTLDRGSPARDRGVFGLDRVCHRRALADRD